VLEQHKHLLHLLLLHLLLRARRLARAVRQGEAQEAQRLHQLQLPLSGRRQAAQLAQVVGDLGVRAGGGLRQRQQVAGSGAALRHSLQLAQHGPRLALDQRQRLFHRRHRCRQGPL
jgi:hypothetical protein